MNSDEFYFHDWIEENELEFCEDILKSEDFNTKDILVEKLPDGSDGDNLLPEYVDLNIGLKDAKGDDSYYLSPGAIMRVAVLGCQIMWEKNQFAYAIVMDEINEEDVNFMKR